VTCIVQALPLPALCKPLRTYCCFLPAVAVCCAPEHPVGPASQMCILYQGNILSTREGNGNIRAKGLQSLQASTRPGTTHTVMMPLTGEA
jgi:hypothetical protein